MLFRVYHVHQRVHAAVQVSIIFIVQLDELDKLIDASLKPSSIQVLVSGLVRLQFDLLLQFLDFLCQLLVHGAELVVFFGNSLVMRVESHLVFRQLDRLLLEPYIVDANILAIRPHAGIVLANLRIFASQLIRQALLAFKVL